MPASLRLDDATLLVPLTHFTYMNILPARLTEGWQGGHATVEAIGRALAVQYGNPLPWTVIRAALNDALRQGVLQLAPGSAPLGDAANAAGADSHYR